MLINPPSLNELYLNNANVYSWPFTSRVIQQRFAKLYFPGTLNNKDLPVQEMTHTEMDKQ